VQPQTAVQWYRNNNPINGAAGVRYKATQSGTYHARLINHLGCSLITAGKDILIELPKPGIRYPVVNAAVNSPTQLQARAIGKTALWNPFTYLNNPAAHNPVFKGLSEKMYTIKLTTGSGCITIDTQIVKVYKDINFYVPNAFTPNGDGLNDYLYPVAAGFKELSYFRVYNRWGQLLFDLKWNDMGWDGNFKGLPQQTQTVVWMAEGITAEGTAYRQKGTSILLR
jgi:gliding motility-associated-like protein